MKPDILFQLVNSIALVGWLFLITTPRWKWTIALVVSGVIPLLLGLIYLTLIILFFGQSEGDFSSLAGVQQLFKNDFALVAGWTHYLSFDLFIGAWEVRDSRRYQISHWLLIPCLLLTFMFGPIGLIAYYLVRWRYTKKLLHEN